MNWGFLFICFMLASMYRGVRKESSSTIEALIGTVVVTVILLGGVYLAVAALNMIL